MIKILPNLFTLTRLCISILVVALYYIMGNKAFDIIFPLYAIGCISDYIDGHIARKYNITSDFGRCFDIIADKTLLLSAMLVLSLSGAVHYLFTFIILFREFYVSGLREVISARNIIIPASSMGKWKTGFQMIAGGFGICCLAPHTLNFFVQIPVISFFATYVETYTLMLFSISAILTVASAIIYTKQIFWNNAPLS